MRETNITIPFVREIYKEIVNQLQNNNLSVTKQSQWLRRALDELADYSHSREDIVWTEKKQAILEQEVTALQLIFTDNHIFTENHILNANDVNRFKAQLKRARREPLFSNFFEINRSNEHKIQKVLLCAEAMEQTFSMQKIAMASQLHFLQRDLLKKPNYLSRRVYGTALEYWDHIRKESDTFFLKVLDVPEAVCKITSEDLYKAPFLTIRDCCTLNKQNSSKLAQEAFEKSLAALKKKSLVQFFEDQNPDFAPYPEKFQALTGKKPQIVLISIELIPSSNFSFKVKNLFKIDDDES